MIAIGVVCLREYLAMTEDSRPLAIPAYVAVAALIVAAHFGTAFNVLMILAASFPLLFFFGASAQHRDGVTVSIGVTLLGIVWIGIPLAHAVLLRDLPDHGAGPAGRRPGRHLRRRHRRLRHRPHVRQPQDRPQHLAEQDDRGTDRRLRDRHDGLLVRRPLPGLALGRGRADHRRRGRRVAPIGDLFESMLKRDLGTKDTGTLFGPHGGILDRLDAVFFTIVVGYYLSVALVY